MRNIQFFLTACVLISGAGFAQKKPESVGDILKELKTAVAAEPAPVAEPAAEGVDVDAPIEQSAVQAPGGEFMQAQQGVGQAAEVVPERIAARLYRRTLLERDYRTAEVEGMKAVDAAWSTDLVLRSYPLAEWACEKMELSAETSALDVEALFPQVKFPKGSSAIYQPKMNVLFVQNTAENFVVLEALLDAMKVLKDSVDVDQVEIEAKFVEVSEGTLEELGFQWNFDDPTSVGIGGTDLAVDDGAAGLFANTLRGGPAASMPFGSTPSGDGALEPSDTGWSTFRFNDTFSTAPDTMTLSYAGSDPFDLVISALDQSSGTDVLSAPRVTTKSGEEATIRVGELHYYPEVYEGESGTASMLAIAYQDFEEKLLGIELAVTPEVNGNQISLILNPRITELVSWQQYQLAPANSIYSYRQTDTVAYTHDAVVAKLPVYKKREIETEVTIADGSTIGMGGLINEKVEAFEDRVPVLGHLPLVGRLFRNEGERAVKRNLLMFVTAKKIGATGRVMTARSFE